MPWLAAQRLRVHKPVMCGAVSKNGALQVTQRSPDRNGCQPDAVLDLSLKPTSPIAAFSARSLDSADQL
jgi:hypothetical protein